MRVKLQLVICDDDGQEESVTDVVTLKKDHRCIEHRGIIPRISLLSKKAQRANGILQRKPENARPRMASARMQ
jgi:hypothetical protein